VIAKPVFGGKFEIPARSMAAGQPKIAPVAVSIRMEVFAIINR